jgi:carbohydrate-selective porin (OprB family)
MAGLAVAHAGIGAAAIAESEALVAHGGAGMPFEPGETVIEATYRARLMPWLKLQPDLQYVVNPGRRDPDRAECAAVEERPGLWHPVDGQLLTMQQKRLPVRTRRRVPFWSEIASPRGTSAGRPSGGPHNDKHLGCHCERSEAISITGYWVSSVRFAPLQIVE